jgi:wyosine [tRNA(Phe)-imidazoG37] synthetase (radical SAM superfamily)
MLVPGLNDAADQLTAIAGFVAHLRPAVAYIGWATRPPAEGWVRRPDEATLVHAYDIFRAAGLPVELLGTTAAGTFGHTGDAQADLLATTAVHPMNRDEVRDLLARDGATWDVVDDLLRESRLRAVEHNGRTFYLQPLPDAPEDQPGGEGE